MCGKENESISSSKSLLGHFSPTRAIFWPAQAILTNLGYFDQCRTFFDEPRALIDQSKVFSTIQAIFIPTPEFFFFLPAQANFTNSCHFDQLRPFWSTKTFLTSSGHMDLLMLFWPYPLRVLSDRFIFVCQKHKRTIAASLLTTTPITTRTTLYMLLTHLHCLNFNLTVCKHSANVSLGIFVW